MNVELAMEAIELARANPERFDMDTFSNGWHGQDAVTKEDSGFTPPCGTTACFAGWVSYVAAPVGSQVRGATVWEPGKPGQHVEDYAIKALGIAGRQADVLFYYPAGIAEVEAAVKYLAEHPDATAEDLRELPGML